MRSLPDPSSDSPETTEDEAAIHEIRNQSRSVSKWKNLVGSEVAVFLGERLIRTGVLEEITTAGDAGWIAADGVERRSIVEKCLGHELWKLHRPT